MGRLRSEFRSEFNVFSYYYWSEGGQIRKVKILWLASRIVFKR